MAARIRIESISTAPIHPCAQVPPFSQVEARRVRSNLDFQPLVDDMAALEYVTKYATKAEKGSGSFESVLNSVVSRSEEQLPSHASARRVRPCRCGRLCAHTKSPSATPAAISRAPHAHH